MSEELYNSDDFCKLAEQYEELKKENAELTADKAHLMNLFMESSEYVFDVISNMKINDLERKCKALEADYVISNREMLIMQSELGRLKSELARRDEIITRLKEDAESLSSVVIGGVTRDAEDYWECPYCMAMAYNAGDIHHSPDCPVTLHRALMKELE